MISWYHDKLEAVLRALIEFLLKVFLKDLLFVVLEYSKDLNL